MVRAVEAESGKGATTCRAATTLCPSAPFADAALPLHAWYPQVAKRGLDAENGGFLTGREQASSCRWPDDGRQVGPLNEDLIAKNRRSLSARSREPGQFVAIAGFGFFQAPGAAPAFVARAVRAPARGKKLENQRVKRFLRPRGDALPAGRGRHVPENRARILLQPSNRLSSLA